MRPDLHLDPADSALSGDTADADHTAVDVRAPDMAPYTPSRRLGSNPAVARSSRPRPPHHARIARGTTSPVRAADPHAPTPPDPTRFAAPRAVHLPPAPGFIPSTSQLVRRQGFPSYVSPAPRAEPATYQFALGSGPAPALQHVVAVPVALPAPPRWLAPPAEPRESWWPMIIIGLACVLSGAITALLV